MNRQSRFRTVQDAERAVVRVLLTGCLSAVTGFALVIFMASNEVGIGLMAVGGMVLLGGLAWFALTPRYQGEKRDCPHCGRPSPVFRDESYFRCPYCGNVVILRER